MTRSLVFGWLTKYSQDPFSSTTDTALQAMTGNKYYTALGEAVVDSKKGYDTYLIDKAGAAQGGSELIAIRNTARATLVGLLRALISNINAIAKGNVDLLLSSGFPLNRDNRTPIGPLAPPKPPVLTQGSTSGTMKAATGTVYGGSLYTARLAKASAPTVYLYTQQKTAARFMFPGLTPGELYNVDINVIGAAGASDFSDPGTLRVT